MRHFIFDDLNCKDVRMSAVLKIIPSVLNQSLDNSWLPSDNPSSGCKESDKIDLHLEEFQIVCDNNNYFIVNGQQKVSLQNIATIQINGFKFSFEVFEQSSETTPSLNLNSTLLDLYGLDINQSINAINKIKNSEVNKENIDSLAFLNELNCQPISSKSKFITSTENTHKPQWDDLSFNPIDKSTSLESIKPSYFGSSSYPKEGELIPGNEVCEGNILKDLGFE